MYRFAWFRGFEASDADTQTSSGRGAAPSPFKRWFGEAAVQPYDTLLLEGGCVKGVAYAGAAHALETAGALGRIRRFAGSSAGAMAAALLAAGISPSDLTTILLELDFQELLDGDTLKVPARLQGIVANHTSLAETVSALTTELLNGFRNEDSDEVEYKSVTYNPIDLGKRLVTEYGLFKGQRLEEHIEALLFQATGVAHVTFRRLRELRPDVALRLTATSITHQRVTYFDVVATPDLAIARAVRASSAVPLLFAPVEIDGELFVDGGLLKNLPYDAFDLEGHPTLALSIRTPTAAELKSKDDDRKLALPTFSTFFAALLETLTFGEGSANCLSHALVRDGLDLVELGVYEYGAAGLGFDVTRADKLKMIEAAHDAVRVHLEAAERDGGLFEDRRPWEPRDPLDLDDDRDDAT